MRGAQREHHLLLLRQFFKAVRARAYPSSGAASCFSSSTSSPDSTLFSRSLWSWSGPGRFEDLGLTKPPVILSDGSLKLSGRDSGSSASLLHTRGAKINGSEVKSGFIIMRKGRITQVLKMQHTQQGRGGATIQVELRDVQSGLKSSERLRTGEAIEKVFVDDRTYSFLYAEGDTVFLMEPNTFEQMDVPKSFFGPTAAYLTEAATSSPSVADEDGMEVKVQYFDGTPLSATVPDRVTCVVVEAEPYFKGQTATPQYKKVVLDNGLQIMTPSFVVAGDRIVVDTAENLYMTRAKE